MGQIVFKLNSSSKITAAEGRYKVVSATSWKNFPVNHKDTKPKTPDITVKGDYDLQVRIKDTNGIWSDWAAGKFKVAEKCA